MTTLMPVIEAALTAAPNVAMKLVRLAASCLSTRASDAPAMVDSVTLYGLL